MTRRSQRQRRLTMSDYLSRKLSGLCVYQSCTAQCLADHLLCDQHAKDHRTRNARHMRIVRRYRRVQMRMRR